MLYRPGVIVICNSNDYNCSSKLIDGTECNVIVIESNSNWAITLLLQLNISITPKFNFIDINQTKNSVF